MNGAAFDSVVPTVTTTGLRCRGSPRFRDHGTDPRGLNLEDLRRVLSRTGPRPRLPSRRRPAAPPRRAGPPRARDRGAAVPGTRTPTPRPKPECPPSPRRPPAPRRPTRPRPPAPRPRAASARPASTFASRLPKRTVFPDGSFAKPEPVRVARWPTRTRAGSTDAAASLRPRAGEGLRNQDPPGRRGPRCRDPPAAPSPAGRATLSERGGRCGPRRDAAPPGDAARHSAPGGAPVMAPAGASAPAPRARAGRRRNPERATSRMRGALPGRTTQPPGAARPGEEARQVSGEAGRRPAAQARAAQARAAQARAAQARAALARAALAAAWRPASTAAARARRLAPLLARRAVAGRAVAGRAPANRAGPRAPSGAPPERAPHPRTPPRPPRRRSRPPPASWRPSAPRGLRGSMAVRQAAPRAAARLGPPIRPGSPRRDNSSATAAGRYCGAGLAPGPSPTKNGSSSIAVGGAPTGTTASATSTGISPGAAESCDRGLDGRGLDRRLPCRHLARRRLLHEARGQNLDPRLEVALDADAVGLLRRPEPQDVAGADASLPLDPGRVHVQAARRAGVVGERLVEVGPHTGVDRADPGKVHDQVTVRVGPDQDLGDDLGQGRGGGR